MAQSDMDFALEMLRRAARREASREMPLMVTTFMGLTPLQIHNLMVFYEEKTGEHASKIEGGRPPRTPLGDG